MPLKFNARRRHKFAKKQYRVTNWAEHNQSLRNRGDLTIRITDDARTHWIAPRRGSHGGQLRHSDMAITVCLTLSMVYKLPLRQTQGVMRSIAKLMKLDAPVPDFSTLSYRGKGVRLLTKPAAKITGPGPSCTSLSAILIACRAIDSTGLKIFGEGEWLQKTHKTKAKRKSCCKLHLGLDLTTGDNICAALAWDSVGDITALPEILDRIDKPVSQFLGMALTTAHQLMTCSRPVLVRQSRSLFHHQRTPP